MNKKYINQIELLMPLGLQMLNCLYEIHCNLEEFC